MFRINKKYALIHDVPSKRVHNSNFFCKLNLKRANKLQNKLNAHTCVSIMCYHIILLSLCGLKAQWLPCYWSVATAIRSAGKREELRSLS